jgi:hypothetical protein
VIWAILFITVIVLQIKNVRNKLVPLISASPVLFLAVLMIVNQFDSPFFIIALFFCALGDYLLCLADNPKNSESTKSKQFLFGMGTFAVALILFIIFFITKNYYHFSPTSWLWFGNLLFGVYALRSVHKGLKADKSKLLAETIYFIILTLMIYFPSTISPVMFLGATLWYYCDITIALRMNVVQAPTTDLDTWGAYDLGIYIMVASIT